MRSCYRSRSSDTGKRSRGGASGNESCTSFESTCSGSLSVGKVLQLLVKVLLALLRSALYRTVAAYAPVVHHLILAFAVVDTPLSQHNRYSLYTSLDTFDSALSEPQACPLLYGLCPALLI